jgi:hypothetical protein
MLKGRALKQRLKARAELRRRALLIMSDPLSVAVR